MIVSAVSLWKKYQLNTPLRVNEWGEETRKQRVYSHLHFFGHTVEDGSVRIYARFGKPSGEGKFPTILFLPDAGEVVDEEIMDYFIEKGYAVLVPDYSGEMPDDAPDTQRTVYPNSLAYGNYQSAVGLYSLEGVETDKTAWFEWTYVALFALKYLKTREDVGKIGVVGVRKGGDIAWQVMLSEDVSCGVPINAAGWRSSAHLPKFGTMAVHHLSDDHHRYIAAVEAQSYAPYVQCPVLMLCALRDREFDCDRAYDTFSRIGNEEGNALTYSLDCGACIGPQGLTDLDLFLEKNLKGREIYLPDTLNVVVSGNCEELDIRVECDKEGILEEAGIFYAEADIKTKSTYRDWRCIFKTQGRMVKDGITGCKVKPFEGANAVYLFAYAKYINGFRVTSKITYKKLENPDPNAARTRHLFSATEMDGLEIAQYQDYAIGKIFLEKDAIPKTSVGYGGIVGAYSVGGVRTYKISSPRFLPEENAFLEFDAYSANTQKLRVSIEVADVDTEEERYSCEVEVKGGGKWKRVILEAGDFKGEKCGYTLENFVRGSALVFDCAEEEQEFSVTNILWL